MMMQEIRDQLTDCKTTDRYVHSGNQRFWVFGVGADAGLLVERVVGNVRKRLMTLDWSLVDSIEPAAK